MIVLSSIIDYVKQSNPELTFLESEEKKILSLLESKESKDSKESLTFEDSNDVNDANDTLSKIYERMEELKSSESKIYSILTGLSFTSEQMKLNVKDLSGGWQKRLSLACALYIDPDVLLLDEPTNHLDFEACGWLKSYLLNLHNSKKITVIVCHDQNFLNEVVTDVLDITTPMSTSTDIDNSSKSSSTLTIKNYRGNLTKYKSGKTMLKSQEKNKFDVEMKKIKKLRRSIQRFKVEGDAVKNKTKILKKLESKTENFLFEKKFKFNFLQPEIIENDSYLVMLNHVYFSYNSSDSNDSDNSDSDNNHYLLKNVTVRIDFRSRISIIAPNGAGKSTILKLINKTIEPVKGKVDVNPYAKISIFNQHHAEQLDLECTAFDFFKSKFPTEPEQTISNQLGAFQISTAKAKQKIKLFSGGQKTRLCLSILAFEKPHLLILDEPTNHLDLESVDALIGALKNFKGAVCCISHDEYFISSIPKEFWAIRSDSANGSNGKNGQVKVFHDLESAKKFAY